LTQQQWACDLLAAFCALQAVGTIAVDMNRTHAANPLWLHHARFHVVWQAATTAALAGVELALLLACGPVTVRRFCLVLVLAALPALGFFVALVTRRVYGGTLSDPNGIPPLRIRRGNSALRIDLNLFAEVVTIFVLAAILLLYCA
jgi:hypothetical protein